MLRQIKHIRLFIKRLRRKYPQRLRKQLYIVLEVPLVPI